MNYPKLKNHVRFYKYNDLRMVKIENPITFPYVYVYEENEKHGMTCVATKSVTTYHPYGYKDWVQIDEPPEYIMKSQQFKWYYEKWKKNK